MRKYLCAVKKEWRYQTGLMRQSVQEMAHDPAFWGAIGLIVAFLAVGALLLKLSIGFDKILGILNPRLRVCGDLTNAKAFAVILLGIVFAWLSVLALGEWGHWSRYRHHLILADVARQRRHTAILLAGGAVGIGLMGAAMLAGWC